MSVFYVQLRGLIVSVFHPVATPAVVSSGRMVLDFNASAAALGAREGMSTREAKSLISDLNVYEFDAEKCEERRNEWLDIARHYTDEIEAVSPHAAFFDLSKHYDQEDVARLFLDHIERRFSYSYIAGLSPTKWVAQSLANFPLRVMPLPGLALFRESVQVLSPIDPKFRERLDFLGYRRVGDVQTLPLATLKSQFDGEAMRILLAANGALCDPIYSNYPMPSAHTVRSLVGGCADLQQLDFVLSEMCRELMVELNTRSLDAKEARLIVGLEDDQIEFATTYARPIRAATALRVSLSRIIQEKIRQPVYRFCIVLPNLVGAKPRQRTIKGMAYSDTGHVEDALEPLRNKLGNYAIHLASEHQEPRRVEVLRAWSKATGWI